jgi:hypothetical protein
LDIKKRLDNIKKKTEIYLNFLDSNSAPCYLNVWPVNVFMGMEGFGKHWSRPSNLGRGFH